MPSQIIPDVGLQNRLDELNAVAAITAFKAAVA